MKEIFEIKNLEDLPETADRIRELLLDEVNEGEQPYRIVLFYGNMGSGKTTLIREICASMNVMDTVTSPTFALINEYSTDLGDPIYHFDFYRINSLEEVFDLGYEEYFYSGHLCLIEWPEKIAPLLPGKEDPEIRTAIIRISETGDESRVITIEDDV